MACQFWFWCTVIGFIKWTKVALFLRNFFITNFMSPFLTFYLLLFVKIRVSVVHNFYASLGSVNFLHWHPRDFTNLLVCKFTNGVLYYLALLSVCTYLRGHWEVFPFHKFVTTFCIWGSCLFLSYFIMVCISAATTLQCVQGNGDCDFISKHSWQHLPTIIWGHSGSRFTSAVACFLETGLLSSQKNLQFIFNRSLSVCLNEDSCSIDFGRVASETIVDSCVLIYSATNLCYVLFIFFK